MLGSFVPRPFAAGQEGDPLRLSASAVLYLSFLSSGLGLRTQQGTVVGV